MKILKKVCFVCFRTRHNKKDNWKHTTKSRFETSRDSFVCKWDMQNSAFTESRYWL